RALPLAEALRDGVLLAYEMNGMPLPPQHGWPVRLVVPGWYGMAQVKWLTAVTVLAEPFTGFQNAVADRLKRDAGGPREAGPRSRPRALMIPPGYPDFMSRTRFVRPGEHLVHGRAWSGWAPVSRVEVSADGGATWADAVVGPAPDRYAWHAWRYLWRAAPGGGGVRGPGPHQGGHLPPGA